MFGRNNIYDWLIDNSHQGITPCVCPTSKIERSIKVCIAGIPAIQTLEKPCIVRSFRDGFMATGTGFRGICGGNSHKYPAFSNSFILYKTPQLGKSPVREQPIQLLSSPPFPYSTQVFHNNKIPCIYATYNLLANPMVCILHKPCLSAPKLPKMPLGRLRAFALQYASKPLDFSNMMFNPFEKLLIRSGGKVVYAEVNSNNFRVQATDAGIDLFGNNDVQKHFLSVFGKGSTSYFPIPISFTIIFGNMKDGLMPSFNSREGAFTGKFKPIRTLVVLDGKFFRKINFSVLTAFFSFKRGFDGFANELRGQTAKCLYLPVSQLMQGFKTIAETPKILPYLKAGVSLR